MSQLLTQAQILQECLDTIHDNGLQPRDRLQRIAARIDQLLRLPAAMGSEATLLVETERRMVDADADRATAAMMERAQVFASAWALVGTRFDSGGALEAAEQVKAEMKANIEPMARAAARYTKLRDLPDEWMGEPNIPCIAIPTGATSGYYCNGKTADQAVDDFFIVRLSGQPGRVS